MMKHTIKDVARQAGVSISTVSRVLNGNGYVSEETQQRVRAAIRELRYTPSTAGRGMPMGTGKTLGIIVPDICNPFFTEVYDAANQMVEKHNYRLMLYNTGEDIEKESAALQELLEGRIKGLIITPVADDNLLNMPLLAEVQKAGIPLVFVDREMKGISCDGVFIDNVFGAYSATSLLCREGHRRVAIIAGPVNTIPGRERLNGYLQALEEHHVPVESKYIFYGDFKDGSGYQGTCDMLDMPDPPTAIFSSNNLMTLGCMKAVMERGMRIPEDIAFIGFDDVEMLDILGLDLTVVARATREMGRIAGRLLLHHIVSPEENPVYQRVVLQPHLVVRGSECFVRQDRSCATM